MKRRDFVKTALSGLTMLPLAKLTPLQAVESQAVGVGDNAGAGDANNSAQSDVMTAARHDAELNKLLATMQKTIDAGPHKPTVESLNHHATPDWYADAKLGIFVHYGLYSVPAYMGRGCWYGHDMYDPNALCAANKQPRVKSGAYEFHLENYGPLDKFGYKDFAPYLTGSHFDPDQWVRFFKEEVGARFLIPVSAFTDGYAMWDSKLTDWNVVKTGPHRDYIGLLAAAARRQGLKFGVSWHAFYRPYWFGPGRHAGTDMHPPYSGTPWSLYGPTTATPEFIEDCLGRLVELVDGYQPDLVWFDNDTESVNPSVLRQFAAFYFNRAAHWKKSVVINEKTDRFPPHAVVLDIERGKELGLRSELWQSDTSVSWYDWSYIHNDRFKTEGELVHTLVDIVSKNGVLLLDIGPRADGTFPPEPQGLLRDLGAWLKVNGDAIYGTRPCWTLGFGEGPHNPLGGTNNDQAVQYNEHDFRFTQKGPVIYAIAMGWPIVADHFLIKSLSTKSVDGNISEVRLLGSTAPLHWKLTEQGLRIRRPPHPDYYSAYPFAITIHGKVVKTPESSDSAVDASDDKASK